MSAKLSPAHPRLGYRCMFGTKHNQFWTAEKRCCHKKWLPTFASGYGKCSWCNDQFSKRSQNFKKWNNVKKGSGIFCRLSPGYKTSPTSALVSLKRHYICHNLLLHVPEAYSPVFFLFILVSSCVSLLQLDRLSRSSVKVSPGCLRFNPTLCPWLTVSVVSSGISFKASEEISFSEGQSSLGASFSWKCEVSITLALQSVTSPGKYRYCD